MIFSAILKSKVGFDEWIWPAIIKLRMTHPIQLEIRLAAWSSRMPRSVSDIIIIIIISVLSRSWVQQTFKQIAPFVECDSHSCTCNKSFLEPLHHTVTTRNRFAKTLSGANYAILVCHSAESRQCYTAGSCRPPPASRVSLCIVQGIRQGCVIQW